MTVEITDVADTAPRWGLEFFVFALSGAPGRPAVR
jgi:hypothetical protein